MSLSDNNQADAVEALNSTSRYLDVLLNFDKLCFEQMVSLIYHTEIEVSLANLFDTEVPFLDLNSP